LTPVGNHRRIVRVFTVHPDGKADERRLRVLARRLLRQEGWDLEVTIIVADDAELRRLHAQFLGEDETTDVMAFSGDPQDGTPGEIYISLDQAREQALEDGEPVQKAVERLAVHGLLHLGGWRDDSDDQRRRMLEYGERYLEGSYEDPVPPA
jgi:rRNA maturation RNase YbeY